MRIALHYFYAAAAVLIGTAATAADFSIPTNTITQNGGHTIDGSDSLTVEDGVSVDLTGSSGTDAISATGGTNTVLSFGNIYSDASTGISTVGGNDTVSNFGSIVTTGNTAVGIGMTNNSITLTNTGNISTSGTNSHGVEFTGTVTSFSNSGTIAVTGAGADAVRFNVSTTNMTTSGKITSSSGAAIRFAAENSLGISAPAFFEGDLIATGLTSVSYATGASQSNLWTLTGGGWAVPVVTGAVPYVIGVGQIASVDPTQFIETYSTLAELNAGIGSVLSDRLQRFQSGAGALTVATRSTKAKGPVVEEPPLIAPRENHNWITGFGGLAAHSTRGNFLAYNASFAGFAAGRDGFVSSNLLMGVFGGLSNARSRADATFSTSQTISDTGIFGGLYGTQAVRSGFLDFALTGGIRRHTSLRTINNNAVGGGVQVATAEYNSLFVSPSAKLSRRFFPTARWTITPSAELKYLVAWIGGYTETGSAANLTVASRQIDIAQGRFQVDFSRAVGRTNVNAIVGVLGRSALGGDTVSATLLATPITYATASNPDALSGYAGLKLNRKFGEAMFGTLSVEQTFGSSGAHRLLGIASLRFEF